MNDPNASERRSVPRAVKVVWVLVAITAIVSLLYGVVYLLGLPFGIPVVSQFRNLALSPNGALLAAGAQDGIVRLWEVPRRINTKVPEELVHQEELWPRRELVGHRSPSVAVAFSGRGETLASIDEAGEVLVWDTASGEQSSQQSVGAGKLRDADFGSDASVVAVLGEDGLVRVWDLTSGEEIRAVGPAEGDSLVVALSSDASLVAAGNGANILVWDAASGEPVQELVGYWEDAEKQDDWLGHDEEVTALAFSPKGDQLASGSADTTIMFWDLETGEVASPSEGHWATVTTMKFSDDGGFLLSGGLDNKIRDLRSEGGKTTATFQGNMSGVRGTAYTPKGDATLSASDDGTVRAWDMANQYYVHIEWSKIGFQPGWGRVLGVWMLFSGVVGLVALWGLRGFRTWSHLVALALYIIGPIIVLGLPLLEMLNYPISTAARLQIAWPLVIMGVWYIILDFALMREPVEVRYQAPADASLSEQLVISQRTAKTRFGILSFSVWVGLLVILYSLLRRFDLDIAFMGHFFQFIMAGATLTVVVSAASIVLAIILALLGALGRLSTSPIANGVSGFYISLIRGTPLLVQIFIWYLGLPRLGIILDPVVAGILALGVNYGAYMTEIFRAGIQAVTVGQREAASALGMSGGQTFRKIILPQAFRIVIPPIGNQFIAMMKDSSLVMVMGVWELTFRAQKIGRQNFRNLETFLIAAGFYWILTVIFQVLQGKLEEHMARGERR